MSISLAVPVSPTCLVSPACLRGLFRLSSVRLLGVSLISLLLSACVGVPGDDGFAAVEQMTRERLDKTIARQPVAASAASATSAATPAAPAAATPVATHAALDRLRTQPLTVEDAVQIALLNNPGLQVSYAELGIAQAELMRAGTLPNPRISYLRASHGDEFKLETVIGFNVLALFTAPLASRMEARRFEAVKADVAATVLRLAADTRLAWVQAVAANEKLRYAERVQASAAAGAELAQRMQAAGNFSRLAQLREKAFHSEAATSLALARLQAAEQREQLARLMGLSGGQRDFKLPERLPDVPGEVPVSLRDVEDLQARALQARLDVLAAQRQAESLAQSLGLTRATRFVNVLELGPARVTETPSPRKRGYEISFELPLFDFGTARVARAEALYTQALYQVAAVALNAQAEARSVHGQWHSQWQQARHQREQVLPLRKQISEEVLLRYNGGFVSVFELLADARGQIAAVSASIEATRDFWLADAQLQAMLAGSPVGSLRVNSAGKPGSNLGSQLGKNVGSGASLTFVTGENNATH